MVKNLLAKQETWIRSLGWEGLLEKGMAQSTPVFLPGEFHGEFLPRFHSRGTWRAADHEIEKSRTQLSN